MGPGVRRDDYCTESSRAFFRILTRKREGGDEAAAGAVGENEGAAVAFGDGVGDGEAEAGAAGRAAARRLGPVERLGGAGELATRQTRAAVRGPGPFRAPLPPRPAQP